MAVVSEANLTLCEMLSTWEICGVLSSLAMIRLLYISSFSFFLRSFALNGIEEFISLIEKVFDWP